MNSQELRALQEAYNQVYDEAYKSLPHEKMIAKSNKFDKQYKTGPTRTDAEYKSTTDALRRRSDTHLATKFHDPKQSQEKSAANKNRPENEKRSKTVSNEPKRFPNRLRRADGQGIKDSYEYELDEVSSADYTALAKTKKPRSKESIQARYHAKRLSNPEPETGKKSSRPSSPLRSKMTQDTRDAGREASEYGSYDEPGTVGSGAKGSLPKGKKLERQRKTGVSESFDLYDIILSHLLDEGYADTNEAALAIMANMSEDWRESIVEGEEKKEEPQKPFTGEGPKKPKGWRPTGPKLKSGQRPGYAR